MKKYFLHLLLLSFLAPCCAWGQSTKIWNMNYDGLARTFRVHLPPGLDTCEHVPLVFNLHGSGSAGWQEELYTQFSDVADTGRFIAVYPDAVNAQWNINNIISAGVDDVGFISAIVDTIYETYRINRNKVYSCGMSLGGFMSYRLGCELSNRIAAIGSVTGLLPITLACNLSRPVPLIDMHGTDDPTVPYSGVDTSISAWLAKNNCPQNPVVTNLPDINTNDSTTVTMSYYAPCDDSTEVVLYTINGGEHTWPDAFGTIGRTSRDINASSTIWNFFKKYQLHSYAEPTPCITAGAAEAKINSAASARYLPSTRQIEITAPAHAASFILFDAAGRRLREKKLQGEKNILISAEDISQGVYFYILTNNGSLTGKGKLIVW